MRTTLVLGLILMLTVGAQVAHGQDCRELVATADKAFLAGANDKAKALYEQGAAQNCADAHFALAFKYNLPQGEGMAHLETAARLGHAKALELALNRLLFETSDLFSTDPRQALALYQECKKAHPEMKIYDEANKLRIMKMCAEPQPFDAKAFARKYAIRDTGGTYWVWMLAEEASKGGRFGKPDAELVLDLVMRGAGAPAELDSAVTETYANWKKGVVKPFNICDYVTSGMGQGFCAGREEEADSPVRDERLEDLKAKVRPEARTLLDKAYDAASAFLQAKTENEEGHGGTGMAAQILDSRREQLNAWLDLAAKVTGKFAPPSAETPDAADRRLNETYKGLMDRLKSVDTDAIPYWTATPENIRATQRLWIKYRDASARLFVRLNPGVREESWKAWLTGLRVKDLEAVVQMIDERI